MAKHVFIAFFFTTLSLAWSGAAKMENQWGRTMGARRAFRRQICLALLQFDDRTQLRSRRHFSQTGYVVKAENTAKNL